MANCKNLKEISRELVALQQETQSVLVTVRGRRGPAAGGLRWSEELVLTTLDTPEEELEVEGQTAEVIGRDPHSGVVLLRLPTEQPFQARPWAENHDPGLVMLVGVEGAQLVFYSGGRPRLPQLKLFSGGVAVNLDGEVLGFCVPGPAPVIPYQRLKGLVAALLEGRVAPPGFLGLGLHPAEWQGRPAVLVIRVEPGGPAEEAGLLVGDLLTGVEGRPVARVEELFEHLKEVTAGSEVELELLRGGGPLQLKVKMGARPGPPPGHRGPRGQQIRRKIRKVVRHIMAGDHGPTL